jgi:hypothetical protein
MLSHGIAAAGQKELRLVRRYFSYLVVHPDSE